MDRGQEWKDNMLGERNISTGDAKVELFKRYYDVSHMITLAGATDPNNQDSNVYNEERVRDALQRNAPFIRVVNDGTSNLFVLVSHGGEQTFSPENVIYPGDTKDYVNVYGLRLRSSVVGHPYRVSEYHIERTCCPTSGTSVTLVRFPPIEKAVLHDRVLPAIGANFIATDIIPTNTPSSYIVQVAISVAGIFYATITNTGDTQVVTFNSGVALVAGALYIFEILVHSGDTINFRYSTTTGTIQILRVQEADSAVI